MEDLNVDSQQANESLAGNDNYPQEIPDNRYQNSFQDIESELEALYHGVGMRDISHSGIIELRGNDVLDFLHRISTNSVKNLSKGEIVKTLFCTEKGRIIDTATVVNLDDYQLVICSQEHHEKIMIWLNKYVIADDVKINNVNGKYTLLEILGPQVDSFMILINGSVVNNIPVNSVKVLDTDGIIFFLVKQLDHNGDLMYWILADPNYAQKLIRYMIENKGAFNLQLIGEKAYEHYRVEQGIPVAPSEINDIHNPHEVGLMNLVNNFKGCYIGQEVILRLNTYDKVQKQLCGFIFSEAIEEHEKFVLFDEANVEAGNITSSIYSYKFKKHIGLGFVRRNWFEDGKVLTAKSGDNISVKVTVKKLPFKK